MIVRRLDADHDMTFGQGRADYSFDAEACSQKVKTRLLLLKEEWFLDVDAGVPYLQKIMVKPADIALAESILKSVILKTEGISAITSFEIGFNRETRVATIAASVRTVYDSIENIRVSI